MTRTQTPGRADGRRFGVGPITIVLAVGCGLTVANIYYAQPVLDLVARDFGIGQGAAMVAVTATQLGYAAGMVLLLPLGDLVENRALATRTLAGTAAALVVAGLSPSFGLFLVMCVAVGITSVVAQILVPLATYLAPDARRGAMVGRVMSGLLLGILLARTVSSVVADQWGWRAIFLISAALMVVLAVALRLVLPRRRPARTLGYARLMGTLATLVREEPALRRRALAQGLMFGAFTAYWTGIAFELVGAHGLSQTGVGLFALVGAAGALAAPVAGRLGDAGLGARLTGITAALGVGSLLLGWLGAGSVWLLAVAGVTLDLAVQGHQILSQREIYGLRPEARGRVNAVFMTTVFVFGALSSAATGALHDRLGWAGTALLGATLCAGAFTVWVGHEFPRRARIARMAR